MEHLAPSLSFIKQLRSGMENGNSVSASLGGCFKAQGTEFSKKMNLWWFHWQSGQTTPFYFKSHYQKCLVELLVGGLEGTPIYEPLCLLEKEMEEEFERQWKLYLESLPFKLSLPLLFFFFPAYVVLLLVLF